MLLTPSEPELLRGKELGGSPGTPNPRFEASWRCTGTLLEKLESESGRCEHSPGVLSSDIAPLISGISLLLPAQVLGTFVPACDTAGLFWGQKMFYYGPEITSPLLGGREQSNGRRKAENKSSGHVERICFEELSQGRMFSWSCLGEMLHLLWLQPCDSLGHTFSGDVRFCFSAVASGASRLG